MEVNAQKLLNLVSERFYRNGKYGLERIAFICRLILQVLNAKNEEKLERLSEMQYGQEGYIEKIISSEYFELSKIFDENQIIDIVRTLVELINKCTKIDIANAIQNLVNNDSKFSGLIPTDEFSIKIMQAFAKKLNNGYFVDPCVGSGRLLANLNAKLLVGFEINEYCTVISKLYLKLINNVQNSILTENFLYQDKRNTSELRGKTYIFDPPLNVSLELNYDQIINLKKIGLPQALNTIPSEYAFLSRILSIDTSNFVCIFPNNFLYVQDRFKTEFRRYLLENSIIAVIQSNFADNNSIQKLILVGKNKLEFPEQTKRYFITFKDKNVSEQDVNTIVDKCLNNEDFEDNTIYDIAKIKTYTLDELRENDFQVVMPQYIEGELNPKDIKSLEEILEDIKTTNRKILEHSTNFETLVANLVAGVKNIQNVSNNSETEKDTKPKNWFDDVPSDLNHALGIFAKEREVSWTRIDFKNDDDFNIDINSLSNCVMHLKEMYNAKRLRYKNNYLELYSKEKLSEYVEKRKFSEIIIEDNNKNDFIKTMFKNLSKKQIEIFNTFIELHFDEQNNFDKFTTSDIHSAIATLKVLGLLNTIPDTDDQYEKYFPYTPILYIREDE